MPYSKMSIRITSAETLIVELIFINFAWIALALSTSNCPEKCICFLSSVAKGRQVVNCSLNELNELPRIPENASSLNFSHNNFIMLHMPAEVSLGYKSIKSLDFSFNKIIAVESNFFKSMPMLESINLSGNNIKEINFFLPTTLKILEINSNYLSSLKGMNSLPYLQALYLAKNFFSDFNLNFTTSDYKNGTTMVALSLLEILDLSENKMITISSSLVHLITHLKYLKLSQNNIMQVDELLHFSGISQLEFLDLSFNHLSLVSSGAFKPLQKLKFLSLSHNNLLRIPTDLPAVEFFDLSYNRIATALESKSSIYIHDILLMGGNPLHCDCHLQWLKDFFDTRKYLLKYVDVSKDKFIPRCETPKQVAGKSWIEMMSEEFVCQTDEEVHVFHHDIANYDNKPGIELQVVAAEANLINIQWKLSHAINAQVKIHFHVFMKQDKVFEILLSKPKSSYTLKYLSPNTAYVICVSLCNEEAIECAKECVEAQTKEDNPTHILHPTGWLATCLFMALFLGILGWLLLRCWRQTDLMFPMPSDALAKEKRKKRE